MRESMDGHRESYRRESERRDARRAVTGEYQPGVSPAPGKESFIARDDNLAKLLPPGWQKTTWEKCLWHPEFVKAARP